MESTLTRGMRQLPIIWLTVAGMFVGSALIGAGVHGWILSVPLGMGKTAVCVVLVTIGAFIHLGSRRLNRQAYFTALAPGRSLSIIYLRPFKTAGVSLIAVNAAMRIWRSLFSGIEEKFLLSLWSLGKVTVVARPSDTLPELAALTTRLKNEQWQPEVAKLIQRADFVAIRVSGSENVLWETRIAASTKPLQRLILWFPPEATWGLQSESTPVSELRNALPHALKSELPTSIERGSFIHFDSDGNPVVSGDAGAFLMEQGVPFRSIIKTIFIFSMSKFWEVGAGLAFGWVYGPNWWP